MASSFAFLSLSIFAFFNAKKFTWHMQQSTFYQMCTRYILLESINFVVVKLVYSKSFNWLNL